MIALWIFSCFACYFHAGFIPLFHVKQRCMLGVCFYVCRYVFIGRIFAFLV
jgi:hypothetical protein